MWKIIPCSILLLSFVFVRCQDTNNVSVEKKGDGCGANYTHVTSSFHLNVSDLAQKECLWYIEPAPASNTSGLISLFFHTLFLHEDDEITLYTSKEDSENDTLSIIDPIRVNNGSITIVTEEKFLVVKLKGNNTVFKRTFEASYDSNTPCHFPIPPAVTRIYSPIHPKLSNASSLECVYTWTADAHFRTIPTFVFEQFNFSSSIVRFDKSTHDGDFPVGLEMDVFPMDKTMSITVKMPIPTNETFCLKRHDVDASCSKHILISDHSSEPFQSPTPVEILNNGSFLTECRWIFEHKTPNKVLSIDFKDLHFDNALDVIAINDGASEISPPLLQVTTSNKNYTMNQIIRSQGPYVWIAFKPITYGSRISGQVTEHGEGGYFRRSGTITATATALDDTVFQLEVESDEIVYLTFTTTSLTSPASLNIYDGFDKSNLLATLRGNIWYPVLSQSSKMMIIATGFATSSFTANFKGVHPGCLHMSTISNENYILSGNCNASCLWVVPPQDRPGSELLLNLQYISLLEGDSIEIIQLDASKTHIGTVYANVTHVPQLVIPANVGAIVEITRAPCPKDKDDIVLVGHSSYVPTCGKNLSVDALSQFQITSPLYPDTYPIFASCLWKISAPKDNIVHLAFNTLKLAPNHCIKVSSSNNLTQQYVGSELPEDLFLSDQSTIEFNSSNCGKSQVTGTFQSSGGFMVNGTVANCGQVFSKPSGEFSVDPNKTLCIWKVSVPETDSTASDVNIISYTISKKDDKGNYELHVYDGSSVRESAIVNNTNSEMWSRTNNLIFIYKRIDATKLSAILTIKYSTISCNASNQCDNKICLHPDWRCNGNNECGDYSDERNCASVPIPPEIKLYGYSSLAFWLTIFLMLATGIIIGVSGPYCYEKYKNGQYRRFGDFSVVQ